MKLPRFWEVQTSISWNARALNLDQRRKNQGRSAGRCFKKLLF